MTDALLGGYLFDKELAAELKLHPRTLRKLEEQGLGPPRTRVGRKVLYRRAAVEEWLLARECSKEERTKQRKMDRHV